MTSITVVGVHGGQLYGTEAAAVLAAADVVVGSPRQLSATQEKRPPLAPTLPLTGPLDDVLARIAEESDSGRAVCVLASGDPGFFGIVRVLGRRFGADRLRVHPAPSSVSLAFARLGLSWDDAAVVSAHGRPLADAVAAVRASRAPSVALLTSPDNPPQALAAALLAAGEPSGSGSAAAPSFAAGEPSRGVARCPAAVVVSRIGEDSESLVIADLATIAGGTFDPMSVLILTGRSARAADASVGWGLADSEFDHRDGMITKAEVRAVALAKLNLPSAGVLWDVGAGSGSVGIECARLSPGLQVFAIERDPDQAAHVRINADRHGAAVTVVEGAAPAALDGLPDPDRVFVGGGGLDGLDVALERLRPGGVVVATYALLDRAAAAASKLGNLVELSVSRGVSTGTLGLRLRAENPVFVCWGPSV